MVCYNSTLKVKLNQILIKDKNNFNAKNEH